MQNDVQSTEQDIFNALIGNTIAQAASLKNFQAMVVLEKNVFFEGETVKGKVVLGKYDANTWFQQVSLDQVKLKTDRLLSR